jgi:hypothetical protein
VIADPAGRLSWASPLIVHRGGAELGLDDGRI